MDTLSRLLALYPVDVALDYRCQLGAPWRLDEPAAQAGVAPYHLITRGSAWLDIPERKDIRLETGDIVVLPHGSAHCLRDGDQPLPAYPSAEPAQVVRVMVNDGPDARAEVLCGQFRFDPRVAGGLFDAMPSLIHIRSAERADLTDMQALVAMLRTETEVERLGSATVVRQLASALFAMLVRAWLEQATEVPGMFALLADMRLRPALQAMLADPSHAWSVNELADACHLSRATFARHFQQCAGTSPGDMLMKTRMVQAAQWLLRDSRSVATIGEAVGYQSEAAFSRAFSRMFGMGPGQYRRTRADAG